MPASLKDQVNHLTAEVEAQTITLTRLEASVTTLQQEITEFKKRYDQKVQPMLTRLEIAKTALAEMENRFLLNRQVSASQHSSWKPPEGYVPVAEQFRRAWTPDHNAPRETIIPSKPLAWTQPETMSPEQREARLKKTYRQLAQRYHPDHASDPVDNVYRNRMMAQINEAYEQEDLEALQVLADQPDNADPDVPVAALRLHHLRQTYQQQEKRISELNQQQFDLTNSDLMKLKIEEKMLKREGRDLLAEIAQDLEKEYATCMKRMDELRRA